MKTQMKNLIRNFKTSNCKVLSTVFSNKEGGFIQGKLSVKYFRQVNNLIDAKSAAGQEKKQRYGKFIEYTNKVYKPSKTITFDRNGELLLYSCDNVKNSQIYLKYPYIMYDAVLPLAIYNFFVDPCKFLFT